MRKLHPLLVFCVCVFALPCTTSLHAETVSVGLTALGFSVGDTVDEIVIEGATLTSETGILIFDNTGGLPPVFGFGGTRGGDADLFLEFSSPINALSITMSDGGCSGCDQDAFRVSLYDFNTNALISTTDTPIFGGLPLGETDVFTLAVSGLNVGRAVIDPGNGGTLPGVLGEGGGVGLTAFQYTTVPLPGAALLFGSGILGLIGMSKRKKVA